MDREFRTLLAELRMEIREIDGEIEQVRREQQFYRKLGFARDIQDMQMLTLLEQRQDAERRLREAQQMANEGERQPMDIVSWAILPAVLVAVGVRSLFARVARAASI